MRLADAILGAAKVPSLGGGEARNPAAASDDEATLARAAVTALDAAALLAENDSARFFAQPGDLAGSGPIRTNVNDCRIILID